MCCVFDVSCLQCLSNLHIHKLRPRGRLFKRASIQTSPREWKLLPPADFPSLWGHSGSKKHQELTFIFAWVRTSLADIKSRKEAKKKQFAKIAEGWFLGAQRFFAAPYTWFERLVPSQGKATKKSGEYEGMIERIQNLGYLPQIIHTGTLQF